MIILSFIRLCHIMSYIMYYYVIPYDIILHHIISDFIISNQIASYCVTSQRIISLQIRLEQFRSRHIVSSSITLCHITSYQVRSNQNMDQHTIYHSTCTVKTKKKLKSHIQYAHGIYRSIPESVVNPGIALAMSAMMLPSCCIRDNVGADVGINVGADVGINVGADIQEKDIEKYFIVRINMNNRLYISVFIRLYLTVTSISYYQYRIDIL